jgi:hypothetical protein
VRKLVDLLILVLAFVFIGARVASSPSSPPDGIRRFANIIWWVVAGAGFVVLFLTFFASR